MHDIRRKGKNQRNCLGYCFWLSNLSTKNLSDEFKQSIIKMFKFTSKDFYKQRQTTDIFLIHVNKVALSSKVSCHNTTRTLPAQCHLMFLKHRSGCFQYRRFEMRFELQLFEKLTTEPIKGEDKYVHGKLKTWKERIKTNFRG